MIQLRKLIWLACILQCFGASLTLPTTSVTTATVTMGNDLAAEYNKRKEEVKQTIYETLGIDPDSFPGINEEEEESGKWKEHKERMDSDIMKNIMINTSENLKKIVFMDKEDSILAHCQSGKYVKELTLQFMFDLKIFQQNTFTNAYIYFYKRDDTPAEEILVKEVPDVGTHEHTINRAFFREHGWVQLDITKQVGYWSADFGYSESRTLKLMCSECTELYIEYCDSKSLPFLTFGFADKDEE